MEEMNSIHHKGKKLLYVCIEFALRVGVHDLVVHAIQLLPLLRTNLIADLARVLARRDNACRNGRWVGAVEGQRAGKSLIIAVPRQGCWTAQCQKQTSPPALR